ncbi:MAG: aminoacyl-tRNA hydrolase [Kiritimatiellia bacterium]
MMLIAGLGNPGSQYKDTPHNVGFAVQDELASRFDGVFREQTLFHSWLAGVAVHGQRVTLMKPSTYMNASGEAVGSWLRYYKAAMESLVVVVDDADLPLGRIRIRARGGSGGHNGLRSIIQHVGGETFIRVRLGIGRDTTRGDMISHVLRPFSKEDVAVVTEMVARAADAVVMIVTEGLERAMNCHNQAVTQEQEMES